MKRRLEREERTFKKWGSDYVKCYVLRRRFKREGRTFSGAENMEERLRTMLRFETSFQKGELYLSRRREALRMMLRFEMSFQNGELCLSRRREGLRTMLRFKTPRRPKREKRTFSDFEKDCVRCYVLSLLR